MEDKNMSGGSHNYMYSRVEEEYGNRMYDKELDELIQDQRENVLYMEIS